jgi:hypothetical protein
VEAGRLGRWAAGFGARHGEVTVAVTPSGLLLTAADGATAETSDPWGEWTGDTADEGHGDDVGDALSAFARHVTAPRRPAVLLVRRGGYACALLDGAEVVASKVGTRYVQGRTAAGGWSQQRFARRREKQTGELAGAVADVAARLLLVPPADRLVTGGDRPLVDRVLEDPRLRPLAGLRRGPHLQVGDPRADLVRSLPQLLTRVRVVVTDP